MKKYYILNYDDVIFYSSIEEALKDIQHCPAYIYIECISPICNIEDKSEVDLKKYIIKKEITKEEKENIKQEVNKFINEKYFLKEDRQKFIDHKIKEASYSWNFNLN